MTTIVDIRRQKVKQILKIIDETLVLDEVFKSAQCGGTASCVFKLCTGCK